MIFNKIIDGVDFSFYCSTWNTRNSWGHEVRLFIDGNQTEMVKLRYYNRTWESYEFRTAIRLVITKIVEREKNLAREIFKGMNDYKIMTQKRTAEFLDFLEKDKRFQTYTKLYNMF
nr:MAG TPA: hypothetical protein [Caudoviricetes sp.]